MTDVPLLRTYDRLLMKRLFVILVLCLPLVAASCGEDPIQPDNEEVEQPSDNPSDTPSDTPTDDPSEDPSDTPADDPSDDPSDTPVPPVTGTVELDRLYGYAEGTTGGQGGQVHHFNDGKKFCEWLKLREKNKSTEPAVVWLSGTFTKDDGRDSGSPWFDIKRTHNLTITGIDGFKMQNVGFFLNEASNIIIRNIHIVQPKADNGADGISMQESHNVWVDHCTFESVNQTKDYEDGSCDVTHETYNVTVSWCHFIKTQKSCLVGHSNSATADEKITVTFHHNYFDLSNSRHPRVRFGRAHVYNNYFNQCSTYGVGSAYGARVLVECNLFDGVRLPIDICTFPAKKSGSSWVSNLTGSVAGYVYERNNEFLNRPSDATDPYPFTNLEYTEYNGTKLDTPLTFEDFRPVYEYVTDPVADLAGIVSTSSGTGKLGYTSAPVEVDNGGLGTSGGSGDGSDSGETPGDGGSDDGDTPGSGDNPGESLGNGWLSAALGGKTSSASVSEGRLTLSANGKFESGAQSFGYVYREVSGNFTATVRIESFAPEKESNQGLAGILMTPDPSKTGTDFIHAMSGKSMSSFYYSFRLAAGEKASKGTMPEASGSSDVVMKLRRDGSDIYVSYSLDGGVTFGGEKKNTLSGLSDKVYVGVAVSSADNSMSGTAEFSGFALDGTQIPF